MSSIDITEALYIYNSIDISTEKFAEYGNEKLEILSDF